MKLDDCRTCLHNKTQFYGTKPSLKVIQCSFSMPDPRPIVWEKNSLTLYHGRFYNDIYVLTSQRFTEGFGCPAWAPSPRLGPKAKAQIPVKWLPAPICEGHWWIGRPNGKPPIVAYVTERRGYFFGYVPLEQVSKPYFDAYPNALYAGPIYPDRQGIFDDITGEGNFWAHPPNDEMKPFIVSNHKLEGKPYTYIPKEPHLEKYLTDFEPGTRFSGPLSPPAPPAAN
jgi:hypothetical protein